MPTLIQILQSKLIPWAADSAEKRMIVARPVMKPHRLPAGVKIERQKIIGERVIAKDKRVYANARNCSALYPAAGLLEVENLKLVCTLSGRTAYQVNDYLLHAGEGYFIFLPPQTPHPDGSKPHLQDDGSSCELLNILLYAGAVQCWICSSENGRHSGSAEENYLLRDETVVRLFQLLMSEGIENADSEASICENLLTAFFQVLQRELLAGRYLLPGPKATRETSVGVSTDFTASLHEYIRAHLHEPLTLESTARRMFLSRAQFARQVKRETGQTFGEILTEFRIEEAKLLLRESEWTAAVIAEFVGFKSVAYFHHLFVRQTGSTPGRFRQSARAPDDS